MKKLLHILGTITLIGTSTTNLIACNTSKYISEELAQLKEKNKIITNGNTLEWIAPQEKPFKQTDNKWYFVIWRANKNDKWRIAKFKNSGPGLIEIDDFNNRQIEKGDLGMGKTLYIINLTGFIKYVTHWPSDYYTHIKTVYRWEGKNEPETPNIDPKTGKIIDLNNIKDVKKDK